MILVCGYPNFEFPVTVYDRDGGTGGGRSYRCSKHQIKIIIWYNERARKRKRLTKSSPYRLHVCKMILLSHFSFGSGGGVPAIGCGRGRGIAVVVDFTV